LSLPFTPNQNHMFYYIAGFFSRPKLCDLLLFISCAYLYLHLAYWNVWNNDTWNFLLSDWLWNIDINLDIMLLQEQLFYMTWSQCWDSHVIPFIVWGYAGEQYGYKNNTKKKLDAQHFGSHANCFSIPVIYANSISIHRKGEAIPFLSI